jgi:hypothetical protein
MEEKFDNLTFSEFAIAEMERELTEEVAFDPAVAHHTFLVGYGRYLYRNGKPEVFGLTLSRQSSRTLHVRLEEREFHKKVVDTASHVDMLTAEGVIAGLERLQERMLTVSKDSDKASVPLLMNIESCIAYARGIAMEGNDMVSRFFQDSPDLAL